MKQTPHRSLCSRVPAHPSYYPLFLNLTGKRTVVVGGGKIAERKTGSLLKAGANVTVISPKVTKKIAIMKQKKMVCHIARPYRKGDLKETFLVIAATDSPVINEQVSKDAPCLVNVVDTPVLCNCIVPSTMIRGQLKIAVSTGGVSPALSRSIRTELEKAYGNDFTKYLQSLKKIRRDAMEMIHDKKKRTAFLKYIASKEMVKKIRKKGCKEMRREAQDLLRKAAES